MLSPHTKALEARIKREAKAMTENKWRWEGATGLEKQVQEDK
jgi:hypothetical protein